MSAKLVPTSADGCRVVSATDPKTVNLDFLDLEPLLFHSSSSLVIVTRLNGPFQTHSSENFLASGIETGMSGSVATNSDH
jgi:hypothetical protein